MRLIPVAVPVPFLDLLTYRVPDGWPTPAVGARVRVPVGTRMVTGCVVGGDAALPAGAEPRNLAEILDDEAFVPPGIVDLCRWVAEYYVSGIGDAMSLAMPPRSRASTGVTGGLPHGFKHRRVAFLAPLADLDGRLTARQRRAVDLLRETPEGIPVSGLRQHGVTADVLARLGSRGIVQFREERDERDPFERGSLTTIAYDASRLLTPEQTRAFEELSTLLDARAFKVALLHGVTGSGKTEVYLRLADRVRRAGGRVLILVPEIGLTPAMAGVLRGIFGDRVAIQHSALSVGERHDQWHRIRRGEVDVVVGTRSAVFAPIDRLALVVVDEEHDSSYKQEETPRYHGRDVAILRASREGALVVLGSATPSVETFHHALAGKYARVTLERRVLERTLPTVRIVNMRDEYAESGPETVISRDLAAGIGQRLKRREQVLVLLNRRGYSTAVFCRQCGDTFDCPNCSVSLTVHTARVGWRARCHYCGYSVQVPTSCRRCAAPYLEHAGVGTEQVEACLRALYPDARIGRVDRDTIRRRGALARVLTSFSCGDLDLLVGTQMIAKGHDFPRVTLVGVISADVGLGLADFRASERTFQLLAQVAGRSGRGELQGEAVVQTLYPDHYSIQLACRQEYQAFFEKEIVYRRHMLYPPFVSLVNGVVRGRTVEEAFRHANAIVRGLEPAAARGAFSILGPAPAPLGRLRGEHRVQFLLKGSRRADMRAALLQAVAAVPDIGRRLTIDVDPVSVL